MSSGSIKTKKCSSCCCVKSTSEFHKNWRARDGFISRCKSCESHLRRAHRNNGGNNGGGNGGANGANGGVNGGNGGANGGANGWWQWLGQWW